MNEMSPLPPPRPACNPLPDEAEDARELEAYFRQQDPVAVAAADWHTRWEHGLDADEMCQFQQWLAAQPAHAAAFTRLHRGSVDVRRIGPAQRRRHAAGLARARRAAASSWWRAGGLWPALVVLCCVVLVTVRYAWLQRPAFDRTYAVARGDMLSVALPDGSTLSLDAQTQTRVSLYGDRREVHLVEGQAMFSVASDPSRPFQVVAGPARITVLGTRFAVRYQRAGSDAGAVTVAVEEGRVQVDGAPETVRAERRVSAELLAGQVVAVAADGALGPVVAVSPASIAPWRQGMLRFENTPLAEVLREMERYGPTGLVLRDPAVGALPVGGSYRIGRADEFARVLPRILPVQVVAGADGSLEVVRAPGR